MALDWQPVYPDLIPRRRRPLAGGIAAMPPWNTGIFPIPDLLAGLTFKAVFPDAVPHRRTPLASYEVSTGALFFVGVVHPTAFLPRYPDTVPHRRLSAAHHPAVAEPPPSQGIVVAQSLAWQARYPPNVVRRLRQPMAGAFYTIPPEVAAGAVVCLTWISQDVTVPTFLNEDLTVPSFLGEGLAQPSFLDEDLC